MSAGPGRPSDPGRSSPPGRAASGRSALALAFGQLRYQLLLVSRSPLATFTVLVIPLMLLVALDLVTPEMTLSALGGVRVPAFLTPAMATFAMLNSCYVNVVTSVVLARESGILKRLHGTPLPLWAYVAGRILAAFCLAALSVTAVVIVAAIFFDVAITAERIEGLAVSLGLGALCFSALGLAVSGLVTRPETALPLAYGTILPLAFVSDVFFPSTSAPAWLRHLAEAFPLSPIARTAEAAYRPPGSWSISHTQLFVVLAWTAGSLLLAVLAFHWEPGRLHPVAAVRTRLRLS